MGLGFKSDYLQCSAWLIATVFVFFVGVLPLATWFQGLRGLAELGSASLVCLFSGLIVLGISMHSINAKQALKGMLLSMLFRLLPPLTVCLLLSMRGSGDDFLGFICYLLAIYMLTLAVETVISVRWISLRT